LLVDDPMPPRFLRARRGGRRRRHRALRTAPRPPLAQLKEAGHSRSLSGRRAPSQNCPCWQPRCRAPARQLLRACRYGKGRGLSFATTRRRSAGPARSARDRPPGPGLSRVGALPWPRRPPRRRACAGLRQKGALRPPAIRCLRPSLSRSPERSAPASARPLPAPR
jgi:hypothetical protein